MRTFQQIISLCAMTILVVGGASAATFTWDNGEGTFNWNTTDTNWSGTVTFPDDGTADTVFGGLGQGSINVTAGMTPQSTSVTSGNYTFTGGDLDAGTLAVSGGAVLTLNNGANGFSGVTLNGGEVQINAGNRLGGAGATITVSDNSTLTTQVNVGNVFNPITIATGKVLTLKGASSSYAQYQGKIEGDGGLFVTMTPSASNPHYIQNVNNTFAGDITISNGAAFFAGNGAVGAANKTIYVIGSSFLQWSGTLASDRTVSLSGTPQFRGSGSQCDALVTGSGFTFQGPQLILNNPANSFVGTVSMVNGAGNILTVSHPGNLNGNGVNFVNPGNVFQIAGTPAGNWTGSLNWSLYSTTIDVVQPDASVNWTGSMFGSGTLNKTGPGKFMANDWQATGALNINDGAFLINDPVTSGMGNMVVATTGTLGGTGMIGLAGGNSVTVNGGLAPGASAGTLTITNGPLVLASTAVLSYELGPTDANGVGYVGLGSNDLVFVAGNLTLDGTLNVTDIGGGVWDPVTGTKVYRLFDYTGVLTDNGLDVSSVGRAWLDLDTVGQVNLVMLIPEPGTMLLLALGGLVVWVRKRLGVVE